MPTVSRTFTVYPPPTVVLDYLKDFAHSEQWDPGTQHCERIDSGPVAEGAYWHNVSRLLGRTAQLTYTLDELTDRRVVFVGEGSSATSVDTITIDPDGTGSAITYETQRQMHGTARLLSPVMKRAIEKLAEDAERRLTAVLNDLADQPDQAGGANR